MLRQTHLQRVHFIKADVMLPDQHPSIFGVKYKLT